MVLLRSAMVVETERDWVRPYLDGKLFQARGEVMHYDPQRGAEQESARLQQAWFNLPFYDYCVFYVDVESLVWARLSLSQLKRLTKTPIFIMAKALAAPAIEDLLRLGAVDFFLHPATESEILPRIRKHLRRLVYDPQCQELQNKVKLPDSYYLPAMPKSRGNALTLHEAAQKYQVLLSDGATLEAFGMAVAARFASSAEGFQPVKRRVVAAFERAFLHTMLSRTEGNISAAARLSGQHRRAFWALMRKHEIDAQPYRDATEQQVFI